MYTLPQFNLLCDIWTGPWVTKVLRVVDVPCNLAMGKRVTDNGAEFNWTNPIPGTAKVLLPKGTDVRDCSTSTTSDLLEIPKGTGRWYVVANVDDIGKGFANEHRYCYLTKACFNIDPAAFPGLFWPTPIP